jgi:type VI secretion system Hcp family effector
MRKNLVMIVAVFFSATAVIFAQPQEVSKYYLQIRVIQGDVTDQHYGNWIKVNSFEQSVTNFANNATSGLAGNSGRADFQNLKIGKDVDRASIRLEHCCANGEVLTDVKLVCVRGTGNVEFYIVTLKDVKVTSYKVKSAEKLPIEEITFSYKEIIWDYCNVTPTGTPGPTRVNGRWDIEQNK